MAKRAATDPSVDISSYDFSIMMIIIIVNIRFPLQINFPNDVNKHDNFPH